MTVVFLHGAGVRPDLSRPADYPLLARLLALAPDLIAPVMPDDPTPEGWMQGMEAALSPLGPDCVVIGHSLGGSMALKWLAECRPGFRARALVILAAPFWGLPGWDYAGFALPAGFAAATGGIGRILLCQAADDPVVSADHLDRYARDLPSATRHLLPEGGHDLDTDGVEPLLRAALFSG